MKKLTAALLLVIFAAGCAIASARKAHSHPVVNPTAALIARATTAECKQFTSVYGSIQAALGTSPTVGTLMFAMNKHENSWNSALEAAGQVPNADGVPTGANTARTIAVDIDQAAVDLANIKVEIALVKLGMIRKSWNKAITDLTIVQAACP